MADIELISHISAPIERCFDLSRSIDLHVASASGTNERAVAGVRTGLIGWGEEVTWRARHVGISFDLTSRITRFDPPTYFQDAMVRGPFASFVHDHHFAVDGATTRMRDVVCFRSPFGPIGRVVDLVVLTRHLTRFIVERNRILKRVAESDVEWKRFLPASS